jgi:hypothetical protein
MSKPRTAWIGLAAIVAMVALSGVGWLMMRSRSDAIPAATGGSPTSLPLPAAPPRPQGTGTARLGWAPIDAAAQGGGTAADPVAGFRVYVGTAPDDLHLEASIDDPTATGFVVEKLPKGTFYYSVTTYTRLGLESEKPAPVSKTIE